MERFKKLEYDKASKVPPIGQLLTSIGESQQNSAFFQIANQLHNRDHLNPTYSLVSLRKIVELSPVVQENSNCEAYNPVNSFKWFYLIHGLASRSLTDDKELDNAKILYVLESYINFAKKADVTKSFVGPFLVGLLSSIARLLEFCDPPEFLTSDEAYDTLLETMKAEDVSNPTVDISSFGVQDIFLFGCPLGIEYLVQTNLFGDTKMLIRAAVLRVLSRILPARLPSPRRKSCRQAGLFGFDFA